MNNNVYLTKTAAAKNAAPDLQERMRAVNLAHCQYPELPAISWSKGVVKGNYSKITFGTYDIKKKEIRVHPILKDLRIPSLVLDFVIYHELLHFEDFYLMRSQDGVVPRRPGGPEAGHKIADMKKRGRIHNKHFHRREKIFPGQKAAEKLMRELASGDFQRREFVAFKETLFD